MNDDNIGLIKEADNYDIWFEPLTDKINGFVVRDKNGFIIQIYKPDKQIE